MTAAVDKIRPKKAQRIWVFIDQSLSSATTFVAAVLAAGLLTDLGFGGWAIAFSVAIVILTTIRAASGDILMILLPVADASSARKLAVGATTLACSAGVAAGVVLAASAPLVGGATRASLIGLALALPGLAVQDCARFALLARQKAVEACVVDAVWLVGSISLLVALRQTNTQSPGLAMVAWGGAALPSALVGARLAGLRLEGAALAGSVRSNRRLMGGLVTNHVTYLLGSLTMVTLVIGLVQDARAAGAVRAAQTLLGPVAVVVAAAALFAQPQITLHLDQNRPAWRTVAEVSIGGVIATVLWASVLLVLPSSVGSDLFGESWEPARELLLPMALIASISALGTGAGTMLRAKRRTGVMARVNLLQMCLQVPAVFIVASRASTNVTLITFAVLTTVATALLWMAAVRLPADWSHRPERVDSLDLTLPSTELDIAQFPTDSAPQEHRAGTAEGVRGQTLPK